MPLKNKMRIRAVNSRLPCVRKSKGKQSILFAVQCLFVIQTRNEHKSRRRCLPLFLFCAELLRLWIKFRSCRSEISLVTDCGNSLATGSNPINFLVVRRWRDVALPFESSTKSGKFQTRDPVAVEN